MTQQGNPSCEKGSTQGLMQLQGETVGSPLTSDTQPNHKPTTPEQCRHGAPRSAHSGHGSLTYPNSRDAFLVLMTYAGTGNQVKPDRSSLCLPAVDSDCSSHSTEYPIPLCDPGCLASILSANINPAFNRMNKSEQSPF